ncbi:MAG: PIG-L family deacetylase [Candidatus Latescibacteria bacterium]|nr:PIG-L family deacetylase [Candidatus Latescibacterota bacterium]
MASRPLKLLLVGAHPADTFDQAGGTLAHHAARGDQVTTVALTTGARSHHWELIDKKRRLQGNLDVEELIEKAVKEKMEEARAAAAILGLHDVRELGFEDDEILLTRDMVEAIADVIRDVAPDVIITHHPYELGGFKLHATTAQATLYAFQQAMGTGRGRKRTHGIPLIFFMNPMGYMGHNSLQYASTSHITIVIDITDVVDKKVKAMDLISSQYYGGAYSRKCHETSDGHAGGLGGVAYAETFQAFFPTVDYTLPVSDADLERAKLEEVPGEGMARRSEIIAAIMPLPPGMEYTSKFRFAKELYGK